MRPIYEAGRQIWKVRFVMLLAFAAAIVGVAYGIQIMKTYGLGEADGGVLKPMHVRLAFGGGVALAGLGAAAGTARYGRRYVARLEVDPTTGEVHLLTLDLLGVHRLVLPREDLGRDSDHHGQSNGRVAVNAAWWKVPVRGYRAPFILDARGVVHDRAAFCWLVRLRPPDRLEGERDLAARRSG